ncbi:MAG: hypothetical protein WDO73_18385 [Ignavibacteriota bacterium]
MLADPLTAPSISLPAESISMTRLMKNEPSLKYSVPLYFKELRRLFPKPTVTPVWAIAGADASARVAIA